MDTRFLESFLAVVESGSLAEAARRLNISPGGLALRIRSLEKELGFGLVARAGRTVMPTAAGLSLASRANDFLHEMRELKALTTEQAVKGHLRLGVAQTAIAAILRRMIPVLAHRYPDLELSIVKGPSAEVYRKLNRSEVDAALLFHPPFEFPKTLEWRSFITEGYIVIAPGGHADGDAHRLLSTLPFVRYDRSLWSGQIADNYLHAVDIRPKERIELDSLDAIAVLVDSGLGVSLVPYWAPPWPEGLAIAELQLPDPAPERHLGLIWPRGSARTALIQVVLEETAASLRPSSGAA